jgi:hypothetical protein
MTVIALALIHHPVLGRRGEVLTTTITTLDLHDLTRSARTYGLEQVYAVHPVQAQRSLAERIRSHWVEGSGRRRIPDRAAALELLRTVATLDDACRDLAPDVGRSGVELWTTAAHPRGAPRTSFAVARRRLTQTERPVLLCLGTGWGLTDELVADADLHLEPIRGAVGSDYNHLSVRAAAAIALDRLLGGS